MSRDKKAKSSKNICRNKLCSSCRRSCKQAANAVVASCPRYYPIAKNLLKRMKDADWEQMELFV